MAAKLAVEAQEEEVVVVKVDMTKGMITVVDMTRTVVGGMMMEVVMVVIMMTAAMEEVDMAVGMAVAMTVAMAVANMVEEEGASPAVVEEEVVQGAPAEDKVGLAEVDKVVVVVAVVVAALVVEVGAHVVVLPEEGVVKVVEEALVHRSASSVVTAIKEVVVATQNQRGSTLITVSSMASRSHSNSGAKTTATVTRVISSGTRTAGRRGSGSDYADWPPFNLSNQNYDEY